MILKSYQISSLNDIKSNFLLFYGENEGFKNEAIESILNSGFTNNIYRYEESEVFNNYENFLNEIFNKSFFEDRKIIIISRVSEKIYSLIDEVRNKEIKDVKIIINSNSLDKRSKLRSNFEKENDLVCVPFYNDDNSTLVKIASQFFYREKISLSREVLNLIVERCRGDRINLKNELSKIESYIKYKKNISTEDILKLTNLAENFSFSELADACLSNNRKKTLMIINENNFSQEDCVAIIRVFLAKARRILSIREMTEVNYDIDKALSTYKPKIFWKDKELVKRQVNYWSLKKIEKLIIYLNDFELLIKKNSPVSIHLLNDFILNQNQLNN